MVSKLTFSNRYGEQNIKPRAYVRRRRIFLKRPTVESSGRTAIRCVADVFVSTTTTRRTSETYYRPFFFFVYRR